MIKAKTHFIPPIDMSLLKRLHTPGSFFFDTTKKNMEAFNEFLGNVPPNYSWDFLTAEAFKELSDSLVKTMPDKEAAIERYRLYWQDVIGQIQAFSSMTAWRLGEIVRSSVWALKRNDVICAAIMSRAALETAAAYAWFQSEVRPTLEQVAARDDPTIIDGLEEKLLKVIYASRLEDAEAIYKPMLIGKIIKNIVEKIPEQDVLQNTYHLLCEVAHPNWAGRSIFVTHFKPGDIPGHERRTISRTPGPTAHPILRASVTALSWATATFPRSSFVLHEAIRSMASHLKRISD